MKRKSTKVPDEAVAVIHRGAPLVAEDIPAMADMVATDLTQAGIGSFYILRAGVGLTCFKQLCDHSNWEARMMELFPNRSVRTLQRYMKDANEFMETYDVAPEAAWAVLSKFDAQQVAALANGRAIAAPGGPRQIGAGETVEDPPAKKGRRAKKDEPAPSPDAPEPTFIQMLLDFMEQRKRAKKPKPTVPPKELTKKQKIEAAIAEAFRVVNLTADWVADGTWVLLPDEELESAMAGLRAAADKIRDEFRNRKAKV